MSHLRLFAHLSTLSATRLSTLGSFDNPTEFDDKKETPSAFFKRFASMGLIDYFRDVFTGGNKKQLLEAIACHKIAAARGGYDALDKMGKLGELERNAQYLLTELNADARQSLLSNPLTLGTDGQVVTKLVVSGLRGTASIAVVLSPGCFSDYESNARMLTKEEIATSGWIQENVNKNDDFVRQLASFASSSPNHRNTATFERVMNVIATVRAEKAKKAEAFFTELSLILPNVKQKNPPPLDKTQIAAALALFSEGYALIEQKGAAASAPRISEWNMVYVPETNMMLIGGFRDGVLIDGDIYFQWSTVDGIRYRAHVKNGKFCHQEDAADAAEGLALQMFPMEFAARHRTEKDVVRPGTSRRAQYDLLREFPGLEKEFIDL